MAWNIFISSWDVLECLAIGKQLYCQVLLVQFGPECWRGASECWEYLSWELRGWAHQTAGTVLNPNGKKVFWPFYILGDLIYFYPHTFISSENFNSEISALLHEKDCPFFFSPHLLTRVSSMLLVILRLSILYIGHRALSNIDRQRRANLGFKIRSILERQTH